MVLERFSIRTQILISFATITIVSMIFISAIAIGNVNLIGSQTEELSTQALENQIIRNMNKTASENAKVIENKFRNAEAAVGKIVIATQDIFTPGNTFQGDVGYHDSETQTTLPDSYFNSEYGEFISNTTSTYYYPEKYTNNGQLTQSMNDTIRMSTHLDAIFSPIYLDNPEYVWLYVGFEINRGGIFRNFPGAQVDVEDREYDPPNEDWYLEAKAAYPNLVYSEPYFDITQGLVVSLTQAIKVDNQFIGVVGLDFKVITIRDKVVDVSFLQTGYASLFETNSLTLVAHPRWDIDNQVGDELPIITDYEPYLADQVDEISRGTSGVTSYLKGTDEYILAYQPLLEDFEGNYIYTLLISVRKEEVISPVDDIRDKISSSLATVRSSTITLALIILVATLAVGLWIANNIARPVAKLTKIAEQITRNATKEDIFEDVLFEADLQSDDEIGDLTRSFSNMVKTLRDEQMQKKTKK